MEVSIEEDDRLCKLTIEEADGTDHAGAWQATVYGKCDSRGESRFKKKRGSSRRDKKR